MTTPPVSRYQQVAANLRDAIVRGDYAPGERLPSTTALAEQYGLSYPTINKAMRLLATQGLVTVTHGHGTTVRERRPVNHVSSHYVTRHENEDRSQWTTETNRQGLDASQQVLAIETVAPSTEVAAYLNLDDDDSVLARKRLLHLGSDPAEIAVSYYPLAIAEGTELADSKPIVGNTVAALERLGYSPVHYTEHVSSRMPTSDEETLLNMSPGTPILHHLRITYAEDEVPVEVTETIMTGDRHVMTYELPAQR